VAAARREVRLLDVPALGGVDRRAAVAADVGAGVQPPVVQGGVEPHAVRARHHVVVRGPAQERPGGRTAATARALAGPLAVAPRLGRGGLLAALLGLGLAALLGDPRVTGLLLGDDLLELALEGGALLVVLLELGDGLVTLRRDRGLEL